MGSVPPPQTCKPKRSESRRIQPGAGVGPAGVTGAGSGAAAGAVSGDAGGEPAGGASAGAAAGAAGAAAAGAASCAIAAAGTSTPRAAREVIKAILVRIANLRVL